MHNKKTMHIRVYVKTLQGFYRCEIVSQLRMLCSLKGYKISIYDTCGQRLDEPVGLDDVDGVIVVKGAISNRLADEIFTTRKIPTVSISHDYYPLKIPIISSDHLLGAQLAIDELLAKGHTKIAYVGHLKTYNDRKIFEDYLELMGDRKLETGETYFFNAEDKFFSGGEQQAKAFVSAGCDATAVIFGSAVTAIGFMEELRLLRPELQARLDGVCFEAFSLVPVLTPGLSAIDQNINLIAYRTLSQIESQIKGYTPDNEMVPPKIIRIKSNPEDSYYEFIAACVDMSEFDNANYMKAVITLMGEFNNQIVESDFDKIMCISPLFRNFLMALTVSTIEHAPSGAQQVRVKKLCNKKGVSIFPDEDTSASFEASDFNPDDSFIDIGLEPTVSVNFCLFDEGRLFELVSVFGDKSTGRGSSSFLAFCTSVNLIVKYYASKKVAELSTPGNHGATIEIDEAASIEWNAISNLTKWSPGAMSLLGFTSRMEQKVYLNMDLMDRLQRDSAFSVQRQIYRVIIDRDEFFERVKIKHKTGMYLDAVLSAKPKSEEPNILQFKLGVEGLRSC